ncbi:L-ascorbate metabolism protein UlaG, beta-lactamase superfamily [Thiohalomonas denitrificans]|uniref:L-ascorbate metabolism protein UlaG, beta-lactamase superfamily n=2 Tax=Thiohalomonas denitrificans TaxID=415747 RepID=A0A1G5R041_9GAMM|nr:L-ascorbate metabolism protein UlaG, beta-lactamase superfamily [Thiohalomonas denitrificans]
MRNRKIKIWVLGLVLTMTMTGCAKSYYHGPESDHFDGEQFFNAGPPRDIGIRDLLRWRFTRDPPEWPESVEVTPDRPPQRIDGEQLRVSFVGHTTLLIQTRGLNILTDPVWSERASPFSWIGPRRVTPPGVAFDDLPPIDIVLVSHNHYDHLDLATLNRLWKRDRPRVIVPLGNDTIIHREHPDLRVEAYDWEDEVALSDDVHLRLAPMFHWSARSLLDRNRALWAAFLLKTPDGNIYFVGDSGWGEGRYFEDAGERFGPIRLAVLPIGDYKPRWFMSYGHMNPDEAVRAHRNIGAHHSLASHFDTFPLADTAYGEPPEDLARAREAHGVSEEALRALPPGSVWWVPPV